MMTQTFNTKPDALKRIQFLVKKHELRFCYNPIVDNNNARVSIEGKVENMNAFNADMRFFQFEIPMVKQKTVWQKFKDFILNIIH